MNSELKNHPLAALSLLIVLFSLAGIPPLAGFFAKFYIFMSVIKRYVRFSNYWTSNNGRVSFLLYEIVKVMYFDNLKKPFESFEIMVCIVH